MLRRCKRSLSMIRDLSKKGKIKPGADKGQTVPGSESVPPQVQDSEDKDSDFVVPVFGVGRASDSSGSTGSDASSSGLDSADTNNNNW